MNPSSVRLIIRSLFIVIVTLAFSNAGHAQSLNAGTVTGTVLDPNKAVVANATVTIENAVTGYKQSANTGADGTFRFDNVPFNNYVYTASASGFGDVRGTVNIRSSVPITLSIPLVVVSATATVTITRGGAEMAENVATTDTHVDPTLLAT